MKAQTEPLLSQTTLLPSLAELSSVDRLSRLYDIVRSLNSIIQIDKLLNQIVASAAEMLEVRGGALMLVDEAGTHLKCEVTSGRVSSQLKGLRAPIDGRSVAGVVALQGSPLIENGASSKSDGSSSTDDSSAYAMRKLMCVPLKVQDRITGVIAVFDKISGEDFDKHDVKLLEAMGDAAAVAIENVRLYEEERKKAELLAQAYEEMHKTYRATLQALTGLLDTRDSATQGHSNRVVAFTLRLARAIGLDRAEQLKALEHGALLHDVGKIGVRDAILRKRGPLTDEEWAEMRAHPEMGYRMLKDIEFLHHALPIVRHHHEHWNGTGYPMGLKGEQIPIEARIFTVVDAFDAITSARPYCKARTYEQAAKILMEESGTTFDPAAVKAFLSVPKEEWEALRREQLLPQGK